MKSLDLGKELDQEIPGTDTARRKLPELVVVVVMVRGRGVKRRPQSLPASESFPVNQLFS